MIKNRLLEFRNYAPSHLWIRTKSGEKAQFFLNVYQKKIEAVYEWLLNHNLPIRIIVLKSRQVGGSTWSTGKIMCLCANQPLKSAMIVAHDAATTSLLFNMCKFYYDNLPIDSKPLRKSSNAQEIIFANPDEKSEITGLRSQIRVGTAGTLTVGRGATIQYLHLSECAFWKNAGTVISALSQVIPAMPGTMIIKESTANGMDGGDGAQFYHDWTDAENGRSAFLPVFCAWWENPEYELTNYRPFEVGDDPVRYGDEKTLYDFLADPKPLRVGKSIDPELQELLECKKGFDHETIIRKLSWRRFKIDNDMGRDLMNPLDQFDQEYPYTPAIAFLSSGRPFWNLRRLQEDILQLEAHPPKILHPLLHVKVTPGFEDFLTVYEEPEEGEMYAIGADIAEGVEGGDASDARVLNSRFTEVAHWHGQVDPDLFGDILVTLGKSYNYATLAPEVNNHGLVTLKRIIALGYPKIFQMPDEKTRDHKKAKRLGWYTIGGDKRSRMLMLTDFNAYHRDHVLTIRDKDLLIEMMSMVREPDGTVILSGKDRAAAMAIAIQVCQRLTFPTVKGAVNVGVTEGQRPLFKSTSEYLEYLNKKNKDEDQFG